MKIKKKKIKKKKMKIAFQVRKNFGALKQIWHSRLQSTISLHFTEGATIWAFTRIKGWNSDVKESVT